MKSHQGKFPVKFMAEKLLVSTTGFYAFCRRLPSGRACEDERLKLRVRAFHAASRGTYGAPRIHRDLKEWGLKVGVRRVGRLMREEGLCGRRKRAFKRTTDSKHKNQITKDLVKRDFRADAPNRLWISDITYIRTWTGWVYLAVIIDVYSKRVVGYALAEHMRTELLLDALKMAVAHRPVEPGLIFHSDRGSQYTSDAFQEALRDLGARSSMGSVGDCFDNAMAESFFATLKEELIYRRGWPRAQDVFLAVCDYIDRFYNVRRRHSSNGGVSPLEFELAQQRRYREAA